LFDFIYFCHSIPPVIYKKVKQVPENKREGQLIKELEEILTKEGLPTNPSEKGEFLLFIFFIVSDPSSLDVSYIICILIELYMHSIIKGDLEAVVSAVPNYLSYNPNN
jgi:hypothetical protein